MAMVGAKTADQRHTFGVVTTRSTLSCPSCDTERLQGTAGRRPCACLGSIRPGGHLTIICDRCGVESMTWCMSWGPGWAAPEPIDDPQFWGDLERQFTEMAPTG